MGLYLPFDFLIPSHLSLASRSLFIVSDVLSFIFFPVLFILSCELVGFVDVLNFLGYASLFH